MPLYDYSCECVHCFEIVVPIVERNQQRCPKCGSKSVTREFHAPFFIDTYSPMHPRQGRGKGINAIVGQRNRDA